MRGRRAEQPETAAGAQAEAQTTGHSQGSQKQVLAQLTSSRLLFVLERVSGRTECSSVEGRGTCETEQAPAWGLAERRNPGDSKGAGRLGASAMWC